MSLFQAVCRAIFIGSIILITIISLLAIIILSLIALFTGQVSWGDVGLLGIFTVVSIIIVGAFQ